MSRKELQAQITELQAKLDEANAVRNKNPDESLNIEEFYDLMQAYRHCPVHEQKEVVARFEKIKDFIKANLT